MAARSWGALAAALVVLGYTLKAYDEDSYLQAQLPGYAGYAQRVRRRLIPWLW